MILPLPSAEMLLSFLLASFLLVIAPGPATFYVIARGRFSARSAALAVAGIVLGDIILIGVAGVGFAAAIVKWPILIVGLKVAGALYVAWLGVGMVMTKTDSTLETIQPARGLDLLRGFWLTLGNPKAILFFAAFFPLFIDKEAGQPWAVSFYALGLVFEIVNLVYFGILTLLVRRPTGPVSSLDLNRVSGIGLLVCAVLILASLICSGKAV